VVTSDPLNAPAQSDLARRAPAGRLAIPRMSARALTVVAGLAVGALVVVNAWSGLMPGVGFWDTGEFQTVLPILGTAHPTGYPTYVILGFVLDHLLAPLGEPAFRITVISLLAVATAAGLTVALVRRLTGSLAIAISAGLGLAVTPLVWQNATRADPHPVHLAFVAALLVALVGWEHARREAAPHADRWLVAAAVIFGLAAGNHSLTLLLAPPIALYVLAVHPGIVRRPGLVAACAVAVVGALAVVYVELPLRAGPFRAPLVYADPATWDGFWYIALAEQFRGSLVDPLGDLPLKAARLFQLALAQFGALALLIPPAFAATAWRAPRYALLTGLAMVITTVFNAGYVNADIERYYLGPVLWAWTWLAVLAAVILQLAVALARRITASSLAPIRAVAPALLAVALLVPSGLDLGARRASADRHAEPGATQWMDEVLPALKPNAVVVSWWWTSTPLWYASLVDGRRSDITVVDDRTVLDLGFGTAIKAIAHFAGDRPVYVVRADPRDLDEIRALYRLTQVAGAGALSVFEVSPRTVPA